MLGLDPPFWLVQAGFLHTDADSGDRGDIVSLYEVATFSDKNEV